MGRHTAITVLASVVAAIALSSSPLVSRADGQWASVNSLAPRFHYAVATVGSKVLIAGGDRYDGDKRDIIYSDQVDIYDTATETWSGAKLAEPRTEIQTATIGSKAFMIGRRIGNTYLDLVDVYDSASDTWSTTHLPDVLSIPTMVAVGDRVIVVGTPPSGPVDVADVYDTATDTWTSTALPDRPVRPLALVAGDVVLFANGTGGAWDTLDVFDAATKQWSTARLSQPRHAPVTATVGSVVSIAGGTTDAGPSDVVDIFDGTTRAWTTAHLTEARAVGLSAVVNGQVLFAGGSRTPNGPDPLSTTVDIFDPASGGWATTRLPHTSYHPDVATPGAHALFSNWSRIDGADVLIVDIYDAVAGTWTSQTLADARENVRAVTVGSQALFIGGSYPGMDRSLRDNSATVDVYDEPSGTWTTGSLRQGRESQRVAVVGSRAVIVGGVRGCQTCDGGQIDPIVDLYTGP